MDFLNNGVSVLETVWDWISGNAVLGSVIGIAVLFLGIGGFIGLFVKR